MTSSHSAQPSSGDALWPGVNRILVYRLGSLGDTIIALPALWAIRDAFPKASITLLGSSPPMTKAARSVSVLEGTGLVDRWMEYPYGLRDPRKLLSLWRSIARGRYDMLVNLNAFRGIIRAYRDRLFFQSCGIRRIIGDPAADRSHRRGERTGVFQMFESEASRIARRVLSIRKVNLESPSAWELKLSESERRRANDVLGELAETEFMAVSLGTKRDTNHWTVANWSAMLARVSHARSGLGVAALGSADERESVELCLGSWRGPRKNLCGDISPRVSAAILAKAILFVGHDSGPMHLAAAVNVPCVAVFSARNLPGVWFPRGTRNTVLYHAMPCQGCGLDVCTARGKQCILSITVDEVASAVLQYLPRVK